MINYEDYIKKCVVKVLTPNNEIAGSGFWILPDAYFLTCYHVFVSGRKRKSDNFVKIEYSSKIFTATYQSELSNPCEDIAVFCVENLDNQTVTCTLLEQDIQREKVDRKVRVFGYRKGLCLGYMLTGQLQPGQDFENVGEVLNLTGISLPDGSSIQGMSGAPVFDSEKQVVVGILYAEEELGPSTSYVHPISKVYNSWKELAARNALLSTAYSSVVLTSDDLSKLERKEKWRNAPDVSVLFGRTQELTQLENWILKDNCRVTAIFGMGGIGKTALAVKLIERIREDFEYIIWHSLENAPSFMETLTDLIKFFSKSADLPRDNDTGLAQLINDYIYGHRCLLVLDNLESIMCTGELAGSYKEGYEDYEKLIRKIGDSKHRSCLILTSREKPKQIFTLQEKYVKSLNLCGLSVADAKQFFGDSNEEKFLGSENEFQLVIENYGGNPLALKIATSVILDSLNGNLFSFVERYLNSGRVIFRDIRDILERQFQRLSTSEKEILYWLAISREPQEDLDIRENHIGLQQSEDFLENITSLLRRSMVEQSGGKFILQPVVREYVTEVFIESLCSEIIKGDISLFNSHYVIDPEAKDYIREIQVRLILLPLKKKVSQKLGSRENLEKAINSILVKLKSDEHAKIGYAAGNIINLLSPSENKSNKFSRNIKEESIEFELDLSRFDFSNLTIRKADFSRFERLRSVNLANCKLDSSIFSEYFGHVFTVASSSTGDLIAFGDGNGSINIFSCVENKYKKIHQFRHKKGRVWSIVFHPTKNFLVSGGDDCSVILWSFESEEESSFQVLGYHSVPVRSLSFSSEGRMLASGDISGNIKIWRIQAESQEASVIYDLDEHKDIVWSLAIHPIEPILASGSDDKTIKLWNLDTGKCLHTLTNHNMEAVRSVAFSIPDEYGECILASSGRDKTIRVWQITQRSNEIELLSELKQTDWIWCLAFSPVKRELLASSSSDKTIRLWNVYNQEYKLLSEDKHAIRSIAFSSNGKTLVMGTYSNSVKILDLEEEKCLKSIQGLDNDILSIAFHPNGNVLASSGDKIIRLWDISKLKQQTLEKGLYQEYQLPCHHQDYIWSVAFHPNGKWLVSGSDDRTIGFWDIAKNKYIDSLNVFARRIRCVTFSPDGKVLACVRSDKGTDRNEYNVWLWEVADNDIPIQSYQPKYKFPIKHSNWLWTLSINHSSSLLASAGEDQNICLWDLKTGEYIATIEKSHKSMVYSLAFSSNSEQEFLASGGGDGVIKLWDITKPQAPKHIKNLKGQYGHTDWVWSVAIRPITDALPQHVLASGSADCTVKLWDLDTGECIQSLEPKGCYLNWVRCVTFSPCGTILASAGDDELIRLWQLAGNNYEHLLTLKTHGPYEGLNIHGVSGLSGAQKETLMRLGAKI